MVKYLCTASTDEIVHLISDIWQIRNQLYFFFTLFFLPVCFVCMPFTAEQGAESYFIFVRNDGEQKEQLVKYK